MLIHVGSCVYNHWLNDIINVYMFAASVYVFLHSTCVFLTNVIIQTHNHQSHNHHLVVPQIHLAKHLLSKKRETGICWVITCGFAYKSFKNILCTTWNRWANLSWDGRLGGRRWMVELMDFWILCSCNNYCWWKKSCTSWYGKYPNNFLGFHTSQVVQDFSHQQ